MTKVGSYEAKTHLARLLDRVQEGERITITRHGVPVAELIPAARTLHMSAANGVKALLAFRRGRKFKGSTLRERIEAGRR